MGENFEYFAVCSSVNGLFCDMCISFQIYFVNLCCPSPHGEGGLKWWDPGGRRTVISPSPHGEGGLKLILLASFLPALLSLPAWGGWIEIAVIRHLGGGSDVPPRMGRVD